MISWSSKAIAKIKVGLYAKPAAIFSKRDTDSIKVFVPISR
jgi:hypothetical protein